MTEGTAPNRPRVTSREIGPRTRALCWAFGIALVAAGGVAAFVSDNQAGTTALVLFGGLLLFIAITERVPLLIEVGTAKLDTSYEDTDFVFEAGREAASATPEVDPAPADSRPSETDRRRVLGGHYRGAVAARAAGITYRQLDYWARTELITPTHLRTGELGGRAYTGNDVILLRLVKELLDSGLSLQEIRHIIEALRSIDLVGSRGMYMKHDRDGVQITSEIGPSDLALPSTIIRLDSTIDRVVQTLDLFDQDPHDELSARRETL
ncbi:MerR family transcriptional regulator [Microbacterium phyllosphaerae]|uniref:MerR family transcriptional regulator n=1 Tax=Microbacterium phyllosphaerae TaxID=124798 RepID=UPI003D769F52